MDENVLNLRFPNGPSETRMLMSRVSRTKRLQTNVRILKVELAWDHIGPSTFLAEDVLEFLAGLVSKTTRLEKVCLKISYPSTGLHRIRTYDAEVVTGVIQTFSRKVVELHVEEAILGGDFDGFLAILREQEALSTLHLERICPLPEYASHHLPALLRTVSNLPFLTSFNFSSPLPVSVPTSSIVSSLVHMTRKASLETLELRSVVSQGDCIQCMTPMLQALHTQTSLQKLALGNPPSSIPELDCQLFSAVGEMLISNQQLKSLTLHTACYTDLLEAARPVLNSLRTNRSLQSLSFIRPDEARLPLQEIPEEFGEVLESDNLSLELLQIYNTRRVKGRKVKHRVPLPTKTELHLKLNRSGRYLLLDVGMLSDDIWMQLLWENRHDADVFYYYLRRNPDLVNIMRTSLCKSSGTSDKACPNAKRQKLDCF